MASLDRSPFRPPMVTATSERTWQGRNGASWTISSAKPQTPDKGAKLLAKHAKLEALQSGPLREHVWLRCWVKLDLPPAETCRYVERAVLT